MYILIVPVMLVSSLIIFLKFTISELDILTKVSGSNISYSSYNRSLSLYYLFSVRR